MNAKRRSTWVTDFSVGFVLFIATLTLVTTLFLLGDGESPFARHVEYRIHAPTASGLMTGARVFLSGVAVGTVSNIDFAEDPDLGDKVELRIRVPSRHSSRFRQGCEAFIATQGLVGDAVVHVTLSKDGDPLAPNSEIPFRSRSLLQEYAGDEFTESTSDLLQNVILMLKQINKGEGSIGMLLKNPDLYTELTSLATSMRTATNQVEQVSTDVGTIIRELRERKGILGRVLFSEADAEEFSKFTHQARSLVESLRTMADGINDGQGALGKLITDDELYSQASQSIAKLSRLADRLERSFDAGHDGAGGSLLARLADDGEVGDAFARLVESLADGSETLERLLDQIESGRGSLSILLRDPSIAMAVRDVVLGVQENDLLRSLVRGAEQSGRQAFIRSSYADGDQRLERIRREILASLRRRNGESGDGEQGRAVPATTEEGTGQPQSQGEAKERAEAAEAAEAGKARKAGEDS